MNRLNKKLAVALLYLSALDCNATLIDQGTSTLDTTTGLEWLDVTLTQGQTYNMLIAGFGGYLAAGYRHATLNELCDLWDPIGQGGIGCLSTSFNNIAAIDPTYALQLTTLFGNTNTPGQGGPGGLFDAGELNIGFLGLGCVELSNICSGGPPNRAFRNLRQWSFGQVSTTVGHWLVQDSTPTGIPEPSTLAIFALGMIGLASRRFKKQS